MKRSLILIFASIVLLCGCGPGMKEVCFKENCFNAELAVTPKERARGLMFREELDADRGMLFIFDSEGIHPFWMKNTLIPLDIIWMDKDKEVVFIKRAAQPCRDGTCPLIHPTKKAKYVLEVNGGTAENIGLNVGDKLSFDVE